MAYNPKTIFSKTYIQCGSWGRFSFGISRTFCHSGAANDGKRLKKTPFVIPQNQLVAFLSVRRNRAPRRARTARVGVHTRHQPVRVGAPSDPWPTRITLAVFVIAHTQFTIGNVGPLDPTRTLHTHASHLARRPRSSTVFRTKLTLLRIAHSNDSEFRCN